MSDVERGVIDFGKSFTETSEQKFSLGGERERVHFPYSKNT